MTFIQPFDLETIFINVFAGSSAIFTGIALILIGFMAAKFKMNNLMFFGMTGLFAIMFSAYVGELYPFMLIIAGLAIGFIMAKIIKN